MGLGVELKIAQRAMGLLLNIGVINHSGKTSKCCGRHTVMRFVKFSFAAAAHNKRVEWSNKELVMTNQYPNGN